MKIFIYIYIKKWNEKALENQVVDDKAQQDPLVAHPLPLCSAEF